MNAMNGNKKRLASNWLSALIAVVFAGLAGAATAETVSTEQVLQQSEREFLNRGEVEHQLSALGVAPEEARQRVDAMTPEEVQVVAGKMDTLAAGGEASRTDWVVILLGAIVIILLV
jgi:hypothetical protein